MIFVAHYLKIHVQRQSSFVNFCVEHWLPFLQLFFRKYYKKYLLITNQLLYQLSYTSIFTFRGASLAILSNNQRPAHYE